MRSLSNRLLLLMAACFTPILLLQALTVPQADAVVMALTAAADSISLIATIVLGLRLIRARASRMPGATAPQPASRLRVWSGQPAGTAAPGCVTATRDFISAALDTSQQAVRSTLDRAPEPAMVLDHAYRLVFRKSLAEVFGNPCPELMVLPFSGATTEPAQADGPARRCPSPAARTARTAVPQNGRVTLCRAIAEKQQTAAALRNSEQRLHVALAGARMGVRELDLVTGQGTWTREAAEILGRAHDDDASFDAWLAAVHPDDQAAVLASWQRALVDAENYHEVEYRFRQHDGGWRWIAAYGRVVFDNQRPVRVVSVVQDISARKRVEADLRESETRLRLAREAAGLGIWDWDLLTGAGIWSPDQWLLWGLQPRPDAPSDMEWAALIHPEDRAQQVAARAAMLDDRSGEADREFRVVRPDGQVRWLLEKATLIRNAHGRLTRIVGVTLDITPSREVQAELRRLGAELRARMEAEVTGREAAQTRAAHAERVHALGQLAGGIAHDFNNVLQTVASTITLIAQRPDDQASLRRLLRMADAATRRGAAITRRLLAFSHCGALAAEPIEATDLLHELREILVHTLGPGIDIAIRLGPALAPFIADRRQLETSLINLATNARDAMPRGGGLILSAAVETVPDDASPHAAGLVPGRYIRLGVADDGIGMDAATLGRATEPFFTTKAAGVGTGLGLAMTKSFAEQSGGDMTVESRPGYGTTVTLWLPVAPPVVPADAMSAPVPAPGDEAAPGPRNEATAPGPDEGGVVPIGVPTGPASPRPQVLLVDDDDPLREALAMVLEDAGYRVLQAAGGREALALLATGPAIDALVTDLSMPGLDGMAVIRVAQERCPGLPAVLLTGHAGDATALMTSGTGTSTYSLLRKPATGPQLTGCLGALLGARPDAACAAGSMDDP